MSADCPIPEPRDDDDGDVAWNLQTASVQWTRGSFADAIVWLRRAVDAAIEVGDKNRASELNGVASTLTEQMLTDAGRRSAHDIDPSSGVPDADDIDDLLIAPAPDRASIDVEIDEPGAAESDVAIPSNVDIASNPFLQKDDTLLSEEPVKVPPDAPPLVASVKPVDSAEVVSSSDLELSSDPIGVPLPISPPSAEVLSTSDLELASEAPSDLAPAEPDELEADLGAAPPTRVAGPPPAPSQLAAPETKPSMAPEADRPTPVPSGVSEPPPEAPPIPAEVHEAATKPPPPSAVAGPEPEPQPEPAPDEPEEAVVEGVALAEVRGFEDLPEDAQAELAGAAKIEQLNLDEEVSNFEVALVVDGWVSVMPNIADFSAATAQRGDVVFTTGTTDEGIDLRVVAGEDGTRVAVWDRETLDKAMSSCPWVADELREVADRFQALAGATMGPLGERFDDSLRAMVTERLNVRSFGPGQTIVEGGKEVPGLHIIGAGRVELLNDDQVVEELGAGDFLYAAQVLAQGSAERTARAGPGGALILFGERMVAHELLVSVPPLLEILGAG